MKPTDFAYHLTNYLGTYLPGQQGVSSNTIKSYRDTFSLLLKYCKEEKGIPPEKLSLKHLDGKIIEGFMQWIEVSRRCSISTRNQRLAVVHAFFRYLQIEAPDNLLAYQRILAIKSKRSQKPSVNYISLEGIKSILAQPDTDTPAGRRDLAMLCVLYDTGARVQEIVDVTVGDVRLEFPATIRLTGKGQKSRIVPVMGQTAELLKKYMEANDMLQSGKKSYPLFSNRMRQKLTRAGISYVLDKYVSAAKDSCPDMIPQTISPHCIRHSKAMHLLQSGINLIYIRDLLGHVDIKTTEVYARADAEMKRKALESTYPNIAPERAFSWQDNAELMGWLHNLCRS